MKNEIRMPWGGMGDGEKVMYLYTKKKKRLHIFIYV